MNPLFRFVLFVFFVCLKTLPALAIELDDRIQVSGFLSFGGGLTDAEAFPGGDNPNDQEDTANPSEDTPKYSAGSGRFFLDDKLRFDQDTRAGLQLDFQLSEQTTASFQIVSKGLVDNYDPEFSWLYLSHSISPDLDVRGGRFRLPIYLASDYLDVGVALPWIRPPVELYSTINLNNITGFDFLYSKQIGKAILTLQPFVGASEFKRGDFTSEFTQLFGFSSAINIDTLTLRAAYMEYEFAINPWPLNDAHAALINAIKAAGQSALLNDINPNGSTTKFMTLGLNWRYDAWMLQSEWGRRNNGYVGGPDVDGFYATLSYQWNKWVPHLTYAFRKDQNTTKKLDNRLESLRTVSPALADASLALHHLVAGIENNESESFTLGLNYHFDASMVGKIELSSVKNQSSTGLFELATKDDTNHILSFVIDVVF